MPRFQVNIVNSREKHFLKRTSLIQVAYFQRKQKVTFFDQIQVRDQNHGRIEDIASNRILVFAQRLLGSPRGKHCKLVEGNIWRKVVSTSKKPILERDQRFFFAVLSSMDKDNGDTRGV